MKTLLSIIFFCCFFTGISQDLITTKNGEQIQCHILSIDTIKITYRLRNESPRHEIKRSEVENYYLSKATSTELEWLNRPLKEFFSIGFYGGIAYPTGDFASMDAESELSGLAFKGYYFNAELTYKLTNHIGIRALYMQQMHRLNYQTVSNSYNSYFSTNNFTAGGGDWQISGLLFGLGFDVPIESTKGLSFIGNLDLGVPKFTFPEQYVMGTPNPQLYSPTKITISQSTTNSGAFKAGIGLRYLASKFLALHVSCSYFSAHPAFFDITVSSSNGYNEIISYEQQIRTLNLQGGLSFLFYRK